MGPLLPLAQLLPIDPQAALDATKQLAEQFQQRFIATTVTIFVLQNVVWLWIHLRRTAKLDEVQEKRVQDQKATNERNAVFMDKTANALEWLLDNRRKPKP